LTVSVFKRWFGCNANASASAPGRVNLLGEHTDYNEGLVLPVAVAQRTTVQIARARDGISRFHSVQLDTEPTRVDSDGPPPDYARYLQGCIDVLREAGHTVPAVWASVDSDVPIGAGLSSSAALEVAMLRALRALLDIAISDIEVAQLAQKAENEYAGVNCGILDQMASSLATTDRMLYLDTRTLERRLLPMPEDAEVLVIDSGVSRSLAASGYNERRAECERAAALLGVTTLRDLAALPPEQTLPPHLYKRVRHVFTENARVRSASAGASAEEFGQLMNESHASLSIDYEVSTRVLDELVAQLQAHEYVHGAKLTGAGFGGACVALIRKRTGEAVASRILSTFGASHPKAAVLA
jgi:galactokinase